MGYLGADIGFVILYHLARYRRKVVRDNLMKSFPEKAPQEIKSIEKRFYHNFCDLFAETFKLRRMKTEKVLEHVTFTNPELLEELYQKGRSVFLATQHSSNWEWLWNTQHTLSSHRHFAVYKKLENKHFDRIVFRLRTNYTDDKDVMIENRQMKNVLERISGTVNAILVLGDQSPRGAETDYWREFLNRDTCWYTGLEKLAKSYNYAVVYAEMVRERRGHYQVTLHKICEDPQTMAEGEILEQYVRHVERFIKTYPDNWLWSHRRWKHTRKTEAS